MKQSKNGLPDQNVYHEPIKVEQVTKVKWIASTKYWVGESELRIDVQQSGNSEKEARRRLNEYLAGRELYNKLLKDNTYSLVTGKQR
jgi:hypothetical protein